VTPRLGVQAASRAVTTEAPHKRESRRGRYEDWPRGRIVFDRSRELFILYADRKLMAPATIARIEEIPRAMFCISVNKLSCP